MKAAVASAEKTVAMVKLTKRQIEVTMIAADISNQNEITEKFIS